MALDRQELVTLLLHILGVSKRRDLGRPLHLVWR